MDLFVVNRHEVVDESKEVDEKANIAKILKRVEKKKRRQLLAQQIIKTKAKREHKRKLKSKLIAIPTGVDEFIDKDICEKINEPEKVENKEKKKRNKRKKLKVSDVEGFTVLGNDAFNKINKVKRVLPKWLSNPIVISVNLQNLNKKVSSLKELDKDIRNKLKANGIKYFFPVQSAVIPWLLKSYKQSSLIIPRDVCVSAPTGSGKTLAFALPVIQALKHHCFKRIRALVILPTRDLAVQVFRTFKKYTQDTHIDVCLITGNSPFSVEQKQLITENNAFGFLSKVDILVCTAGRLVDHLKGTIGFSLEHLEYLIIDEADKVLDNIQNDWLYHLEHHMNKNSMFIN